MGADSTTSISDSETMTPVTMICKNDMTISCTITLKKLLVLDVSFSVLVTTLIGLWSAPYILYVTVRKPLRNYPYLIAQYQPTPTTDGAPTRRPSVMVKGRGRAIGGMDGGVSRAIWLLLLLYPFGSPS